MTWTQVKLISNTKLQFFYKKSKNNNNNKNKIKIKIKRAYGFTDELFFS